MSQIQKFEGNVQLSGDARLNSLFTALTNYFGSQDYRNDPGKMQIDFNLPTSMKIMIFLILILFVLILCLCLAIIFYLFCRVKNIKSNDIEKASALIPAKSKPIITHSPKKNDHHRILQQKAQVSNLLTKFVPEELLATKNAQNIRCANKKTNKQPYLVEAIDSQKISKSSLSSPLSSVVLVSASDTKTLRQKQSNGNINNELVESDFNSLDKELQERICGNDTGNGRRQRTQTSLNGELL